MANKKKDTEVKGETVIEQPGRKVYEEIGDTVLTVNGIEFPVREFTEEEAEQYDQFYKDAGGHDLDVERRVLEADAEKLPRSKVLDTLNKRIVPLREEYKQVEKEYEEDPENDELFQRMLELGSKLDPLEDQARKAIEHTDYDKMVRQSDDITRRAHSITERLFVIRHNFLHNLASRQGKTAETLERWQERATPEDRANASEVVAQGKAFIRLGKVLSHQSESQMNNSASMVN